MTTRAQDVDNVHVVKAGQPVSYDVAGHDQRSDSPTYQVSRVALHKIFGTLKDWIFGPEPIQDHHGGGLWAYDGEGWFFVRNFIGIEWSGQFCADPAKVDLLRQNAQRFYKGFPKSFDEFKTLGIDLEKLLTTKITDAAGVANWTDSICNASVPLPQPAHTGFVPKGGGVHNYPTPVTDIAYFKRDDFTLWVTDRQGHPAAVVPTTPHGSGKSDIRVVHAQPGSALEKRRTDAATHKKALDLTPADPDGKHLADQAFAKQVAPHKGH
jgi:hypothetical protein